MGDFNVDALNNNHPSTKRLVDLLRSFDLELLVKSPTRVTTNTQSAIDNIITNISDVAVTVVNTAISDHYGQEAIIRGDRLVSDASEVASEFNIFFASVAGGRDPRSSLPQGNPRRRQSPATSLVLAPVFEEEINQIIQQLPNKKS
ncbi:hypothetical protein J6590_094876 [Homalodisca vitripennis]|nr:hypothetical protein J6590_094876 [Homalodisca vitripennis]